MYLKKVEIYGFKSFGNKATIIFDNKVTGVVGPNGSGKSNIVDAIRWVLGEQRVKSLRGDKMEDVIFSGTEQKRALGYAQVTLTLDNEDKLFPIDYSEVSISRRLFRSGESEYYINKSQVRRKDIHELFMDTGLSREGYSIISQGQIESIVNNSAVERKLMIEEAVGIVKYKTRKVEALRKLDKTQNNLYRIIDITSALEKRIPSLERNSEKARKYLELKEELKKIELNLFVHKIDKNNIELTKLKKDEEILKGTSLSLEERFCFIDNNYKGVKEKISYLDEKTTQINEEINTLINSHEGSKTQIAVSKNQIENYRGNIENANVLISEIKESIKLKEDEKNIETDKLLSSEKEFNALNEQYESAKNIVVNLEKQNEEANSVLQTSSAKVKSLEEEISKISDTINSDKTTLNSNEYIIEKLREENSSLSDNILEKKSSLNKVMNTEKNKAIEDMSSKLSALNNEKNSKIKSYETYKEKLLSLYNDIELNTSKRNMYVGFEENNEGYKFAVKKLFEEKNHNPALKEGIYATVGQIINIDEKYANAIQKSLLGSLENIIVKNEGIAKEAINILKKNKWGRVTFLPINIIKSNKLILDPQSKNAKGFLGLGCDLVKVDSKYVSIAENILGRVLIFDTIENANIFSRNTNYKYKIATLDGEILFPGGSLVGGENRNENNDLLTRKSKIEKLTKKVNENKSEYETLLVKNNSYKNTIEKINIELKELTTSFNNLKIELSSHLQKIDLEKEKIKELEDLFNKNNEKIKTLKDININIENTSNSHKEKLENLKEEFSKEKISFDKLNSGVHKDEFIEENNKLNEINIELIKAKQNMSLCEDKIRNIDEIILELKNNITSAKDSIKNNEELIKEKQQSQEQALINDRDFEEKKDQHNELYKKIMSTKSKLLIESNEFDEELEKITKEKNALYEKLSALEREIYKSELIIENMSKDILEDYEYTYTDALKYKYDTPNIPKEETLLKQLKVNIRNLGHINIDSIEEYKSVKKEFEFLTEQKDDLINSREELNKVINDMTTKIEAKFVKEFKGIQEQFDKVFKKLFNGGSAKLILTNPNDIMESGIDIVASPPNTKLKNISSLSGGEKSMTAVALIFAILTIKPTPFCILDEIDAALDDANVSRFCAFLESIKEKNQFVIITHRKITMEIADALYGATMGSEGITKIISVKLKDIESGGAL